MSLLITPSLSEWTTPDLFRLILDGTAAPAETLASKPSAVATPASLSVAGYSVDGFAFAAREASGDLLHWYRIETDLRFTLGDVMGKGTTAARSAAALRSSIVAGADRTPAAALAAANRTTGADLRGAESFATLVLGSVDTERHRVVLADAGHGIVVHLTADGSVHLLRSHDLPIGLQDPRDAFHERTVSLGHGEALVALSDGFLDLGTGMLADLDALGPLWLTTGTTTAFLATLYDRVGADTTLDDDVAVLAVARD